MNDDRTKKLLRLGTEHPRCARCRYTEVDALQRILWQGKPDLILCGNCNAKRTRLSSKAVAQKARRFKDAGYSIPACVVCHEPNIQILELDHTANEANSGVTEPLCATHHAMKSAVAETGPAAALRLRDPNRSALELQAAFEFGAGALLGMFAVWDGAHEETARSICLGVLSAILVAWALWNIAADAHFKKVLGPQYDRAIPAEVPR